MISLELPVPPSANHIWRVGKGRTYLSPEYKLWLKKARILIRNQYRGKPLAGEVFVNIAWFRQTRRGDLDNKAKPILDALKGLAYMDDKQVGRIWLVRYDVSCAHPEKMDVDIDHEDATGVYA